MRESKTIQFLRSKKIFNSSALVGHGGVYVGYRPSQPRSCTCSAYFVRRPGYDLGRAWYDYGNKTFVTSTDKASKAAALQEALTWATERYGITDWVKGPYGDYVSAAVLATALQGFDEYKAANGAADTNTLKGADHV